ncbi:hypothetical protein [Paenibacillus tundrae]|uniref:SWIM-type domain-containing protein n=1 Tax=Paenibacillus tundrae TaxID=528187 RepID=A0ABT9WDL6_9BACL|nr:hypothetical protein [Paenibacillus tundrae]MDQ0171368.1 hypothetical protein [Paenibacillus tundrae]
MSSFEQKFRIFSNLCTEDYLIRYANKGLYKRSLKELDNGVTVDYTWNETSVSCELSEGSMCTLQDTLDQWQCSCPSEQICKHVLISILYYQREHATTDIKNKDEQGEADSGTGLDQANELDEVRIDQASSSIDTASRFRWMLESDLTKLIKSLSSSVIEEVLFRLRYPEVIKVLEDSLFTVYLVSQDIEVSFTEEPSLAKALCKVKQTAGNIAKLEALLRYRMQQGIDDTDSLSTKAFDLKFSLLTVKECRVILADMLKTGLARLPESYLAELETLAITAHSGNLPDIERSLRGIQGELQLFFNRHVRFSMPTLLNRVSKLYLALHVLEQENASAIQQSQLIGRFRSKYYTVPELHLYGIGADAWETRSGFRGITYYFYGLDDQQIYTYSDVRATYYDDHEFSYSEHYGSYIPWLPQVTFRQFAGEEVQFRAVKVNEDCRLSSGEGAKLTILPRTEVEKVNVASLVQEASSILSHDSQEVSLFSAPKERLAIIKVSRILEHYFEPNTQDLMLTVMTEASEELVLTLPYASDWETTIKRLESGYGAAALEHFYTFVRVEQQQIVPISFLKGSTVFSLKLDLGYGRMKRLGRL